MKVLVVAATPFEYEQVKNYVQQSQLKDSIIFATTGVGMLASAVTLVQKIMLTKPTLVIQMGIAGSFDSSFNLTDVVAVKQEFLGDLGVEENGIWKDVFDLQLSTATNEIFTNKGICNSHLSNLNIQQLPEVIGITVNQITTNQHRIKQLADTYNPAIETMEGAALHYVGNYLQTPYVQLRAISNFIGERDKSKWQLQQSIHAINNTVIDYLTFNQLFFKLICY